MQKIELVKEVSQITGFDKDVVLVVIEELMSDIKTSLASGENVYLRNFGTFGVKHRAEKNFHYAPGKYKYLPPHNDAVFIPSKQFMKKVKLSLPVVDE